jgi:hypothetical protein
MLALEQLLMLLIIFYLHVGLTVQLWFLSLLKIYIMTVKMVLLLLNLTVSVPKLDVRYHTMKMFSVKFLNN